MSDGQVRVDVRADNKKLKTDLTASDKQINKFAKDIDKRFGVLSKGLALGFAGAGVAAVKFGAEFEQSLAAATTLFGDVDVDMENLQEQLLDISNATSIAATELTEGLYSALSAGIPITEDAAEATEFLEKSARLAKAGFTDADTAISATAKTLNAYGLEVSETDRIQGILINTQNEGITTVDELGRVLANVTPTAASAGVSFEEVSASIALLTKQGTPASVATTQLNASITAFLRPNKEMVVALESTISKMIDADEITGELAETFIKQRNRLEETAHAYRTLDSSTEDYDKKIKELGKSIDEQQKALDLTTAGLGSQFLEVKGLQGALSTLTEATNGNTASLTKALGSTEAYKASVGLTADNTEEFNRILETMNDTTGLVDEGFEKVSNTTQEKFTKNINELKNVAIELFGSLQEVINVLFEFIEVVKAGEEPIIILGGVIGIITTLIITYNIQQALATANLTVWGAISAGATIATTALGAAFNFLVSPISLIIIAIGAVIIIGVLLAKNWDEIAAFMQETWQKVADFATEIWTNLKQFFIDTMETIKNIVIERFNELVDTTKSVFNNYVSGIKGLITNLKEAFDNLMSFIKNVFSGNWKAAWQDLQDFFRNVFEGLVGFAKAPLNSVIDIVNNVIKGLNKIQIPSAIPGIGGLGVNIPLIPKLAKGGLAFGQTMSIIGDNPDAAINPEVVAPLNTLESMIFDNMTNLGLPGQDSNINLNALVEIDGEQLATIVLKNIDDSKSFV